MMELSTILATAIATIGLWLLVAGLTEAMTEIIKNMFPVKDKITYGISIGIGVILSISFGLNPFGLTGVAAYTSMVGAGILASRGSNYLHGILKKVGIITTTKY